MLYLRPNSENINSIMEASNEILSKGGILAYPTETFYALGAKYDSNRGLRRLASLKKRPPDKPFPLIIGNREMLSLITGSLSDKLLLLTDKFWPGPLTILFPALEPDACPEISRDGKIAVRMPGDSFALELARCISYPITATSANLSGMPPSEDAETVREFFHNSVDAIIDCGATEGGKPSTIIDVIDGEPVVIREGRVRII